jgi:hypothetical protein
MVVSNNRNKYLLFGYLSEKIIKEKINKLINWVWKAETEIPRHRLSFSEDCIINIVNLVERNKMRLYTFHRMNMSEQNEAALYCFWIVKLQPFSEVSPKNEVSRPANEINALIAAKMLCYVANKIRRLKGQRRIKQMNINSIVHIFCYGDISRDSMMAILEGLILGNIVVEKQKNREHQKFTIKVLFGLFARVQELHNDLLLVKGFNNKMQDMDISSYHKDFEKHCSRKNLYIGPEWDIENRQKDKENFARDFNKAFQVAKTRLGV